MFHHKPYFTKTLKIKICSCAHVPFYRFFSIYKKLSGQDNLSHSKDWFKCFNIKKKSRVPPKKVVWNSRVPFSYTYAPCAHCIIDEWVKFAKSYGITFDRYLLFPNSQSSMELLLTDICFSLDSTMIGQSFYIRGGKLKIWLHL